MHRINASSRPSSEGAVCIKSFLGTLTLTMDSGKLLVQNGHESLCAQLGALLSVYVAMSTRKRRRSS